MQPPRLTVVVGPEELIAARAVARVVAAARAADPATEVHELGPGSFEPGALTALLSPTLFGERRVVVVTGAQDLAEDAAAELASAAAVAGDDVSLVVHHAGGPRGRGLLRGLERADAQRVDAARITAASERSDFVRAEFRSAGRAATEDGVRALLDAVGTDLRELATAVVQLAADTDGTVDAEVVGRYHRGRAEVKGFAVADAAVEGRPAQALETLRWALAAGTAPVLVSSALAAAIRDIAAVAGAAGDRQPSGQLAKRLGMPPWKVERVRRRVHAWRPEGLAAALRAVAAADGDVKGGGTDPAYALERAVLAVVAARSGG